MRNQCSDIEKKQVWIQQNIGEQYYLHGSPHSAKKQCTMQARKYMQIKDIFSNIYY